MEGIISWVKSGLLFGVLGSVIIMLSPNKTYEKHISFVVGLLFVLVMIHPVMEFFHVDGTAYLHSIENYLALDTGMEGISENDKQLYCQALELQLKGVITEGGYPIDYVKVKLGHEQEVSEVTLCFLGEVENLSGLEEYLYGLFGEEVVISYEVK
ncbi:MAG: stage III sporulation protein AF [Lachnospiraceae bacterium]